MMRPTRGKGLLEGYLARKRAALADSLIPNVLRDGCIADIGCGSYPMFLAGTKFRRKIGLDRVVADPECGPDGLSDITMINYDLESGVPLPLETGSCSAISMLAVLEHLEPARVPGLLEDIHRVLVPGGMLVLTTPSAWTDSLLRFLAAIRLVSPEEIQEHKAAYTREILSTLLLEVFAADGVRTGHFELFMNIWATARRGEGPMPEKKRETP